MRDDDSLIRERFQRLAGAQLPVPAATSVIRRGRQRRRTTRIAAASGLAVLAIAGLTAAQLAGAGHRSPAPVSTGKSPKPRPSLPPSGTGPLVLGFTSSGYYVMSRVGSTGAPVRVPGLPRDVGGVPQIATNPGGGWVVVYHTGRANHLGLKASRLAVVSAAGAVRSFGPVFGANKFITGLAVRPGDSAVAVGVTKLNSLQTPGHIELVPLPGHPGHVLTWKLSETSAAEVQSLSWENEDVLTYIPGSGRGGGGFAGDGVASLDVSGPSRIAPARSGWPAFGKLPGQCNIDGGTWLGSRYLALESCTSGSEILVFVNAGDGHRDSRGLRISGHGCPDTALNARPGSGQVLVPWCGLQVYAHGRAIVIRGPLTDAAFAG
jgi:hypothetical protein